MNLFMKYPVCGITAVLFGVAGLVLHAGTTAYAAQKKAPPAKAANEYAAFDAHPKEHVTIGVDVCEEARDCDFFRLPYVQHSLLPVRVIITNEGDTAISLEDARFQFISANNDKIPAADLEEINRRMFTFKSTQGTKIPLIPVKIHHAPVDKKVTQDDDNFGFKVTTVQPHSTVAGYLFYDIKQLDDPALKGAELYVKMIHGLNDKKELFAFTIPFDKWLSSRPKALKP